jgi:hypothetical protein
MNSGERALDASMCGHSESARSSDKAERSRRPSDGGRGASTSSAIGGCWFYAAQRRSCLDSSHSCGRARPLLPSWSCSARTRW